MFKKKKNPVLSLLSLILKIIFFATGALFVVNLDQKLLAWAYARVNEIFDRKPADIKF